ncbi:PD-(D/E)XK nuclease family protein [Aequorivita todarodis]|uniref:PD-(D/E)XK nuclease family protein n=1 Tax=Aequorivita todarodis TaxID=2036821 RepID=UPI00234FD061|nr:PD-(D/E)XK nuclease family protein [Aequorivita todarodis]MDC8001386.1 PD-(D/E)XK nuclease family protein [Aequorivita todarodis]
MVEFLYWFYFALATIIFFIEFTKEKNFFIVLIGFLLGGALLLMIPVLPIFLIKLIPDDYLIIREVSAGIYLSILIILCFKYFIIGYLKTEQDEVTLTKKNENTKVTIANSSNHDDFKPKPSNYKSFEKEETNTKVAEPSIEYKTEPTTEQKEKPIRTEQIIKPRKEEILPNSVKENEKEISEIKRVNYSLNLSESETNFPILKIPNKNCVVRSHRLGSTKRRGFKEASFQKAIEYFFSTDFEISGNIRLNTGKNTRPFEPDIAMIGKNNDNIRIDIEIDEPYAGITRQPTHCIGDDVNRDNYFKDRGWIVVRFSEHQVHTKEKECLKFISNLISEIRTEFQTPSDLKTSAQLNKEKVWDIVQAQKWEKNKYREKYLNHEFKILEEQKETLKREFDSQEIEEEKYVVPTSFGQEENERIIAFNKLNQHPRDKRVKFYAEKHIYTIDGVAFPSASTIVGRFFPEFDAFGKAINLSPNNALYGLEAEEIVRIWKEKGLKSAKLGTFLHQQIENYFLNQNFNQTEEFYQFENFVSEHPNLKPYRSEWRIFDEEIGVAGTIDMIVQNQNDFDIYDWKRTRKVINVFDGEPIKIDKWGNCGVGQLEHIDDTSYNRYSLQQSLYRYILEKNYGIKVGKMYLVIMYPEFENYYKVEVPYLKEEIEHILQTV